MIASTGVLFLFNAAFGTAAALLFLRPAVMGARFFRLNGTIATLLAAAALFLFAADRQLDRGLERQLVVWTGLLLTYTATVLWLPGAVERLGLAALAAWGALLSARLLAALDPAALFRQAQAVPFLLGGASIGLALVSMTAGHWYLAAEKLSIAPLRRVTYLLGGSLALRGALLLLSVPASLAGSDGAADVARFLRPEEITMPLLGLIRVLFGIVGPLLLTAMTWQAVRIRSTQSATGILYGLLAQLLVGEGSAVYLTLTSRLPF